MSARIADVEGKTAREGKSARAAYPMPGIKVAGAAAVREKGRICRRSRDLIPARAAAKRRAGEGRGAHPAWAQASRVGTLALIGAGEALVALPLGGVEAALGVVTGVPVGVLNHWLARWSITRWSSAPGSVLWVVGSSLGRLALAGTLLWWASTRSIPYLLGTLAGLLVEVVGYVVLAPEKLRALGRNG